jgi:hypothetical protein
VKTLSGAREGGFALSEWNSLLLGWLKRLNGLNGLYRSLSNLLFRVVCLSFLFFQIVYYYASFNFVDGFFFSFRDRIRRVYMVIFGIMPPFSYQFMKQSFFVIFNSQLSCFLKQILRFNVT